MSTLTAILARHPRRVSAVAGAFVGSLLWQVAGTVSGVVMGVYVMTAIVVAARRRADKLRGVAFDRALDAVARLATELRAGADPAVAVTRILPTIEAAGWDATDLVDRVMAATAVAEQTGAPLSDLLDRLESDSRAAARARAVAAAHASGAQATSWLLAGLPIAGIALGYAIGADPLHVLLHTPVGAASAFLAVALQVAGLVWTHRLSRQIGGDR